MVYSEHCSFFGGGVGGETLVNVQIAAQSTASKTGARVTGATTYELGDSGQVISTTCT